VHHLALKKQSTAVIVILAISICAVAGLLWRLLAYQHAPTAANSCSTYGPLYDAFGPGSIANLNRDARAVIVATVLDKGSQIQDQQHPARVRAEKVLRGGLVHPGQELTLCPQLTLTGSTDQDTVMLFLDGRDGAYWVPAGGPFGMLQKQPNNTFTADWITSGPKALSPDQIQRL
jgi:hypothetical protein